MTVDVYPVRVRDLQQVRETNDGDPITVTRVIVLDMSGPGKVNMAFIDTLLLGLQFFYRTGAPAQVSDGAAE